MRKALATPTRTQRKVLRLVANGLSTEEIAERLGMSFATARTHRYNILRRTGAANMAHAVAMAYEAGWWR